MKQLNQLTTGTIFKFHGKETKHIFSGNKNGLYVFIQADTLKRHIVRNGNLIVVTH